MSLPCVFHKGMRVDQLGFGKTAFDTISNIYLGDEIDGQGDGVTRNNRGFEALKCVRLNGSEPVLRIRKHRVSNTSDWSARKPVSEYEGIHEMDCSRNEFISQVRSVHPSEFRWRICPPSSTPLQITDRLRKLQKEEDQGH